MYYTQEQIDRANQTDLVSFLQSQGEQLTRAGQEYRWKRHDIRRTGRREATLPWAVCLARLLTVFSLNARTS